jgi:6-phosphofructokinase 2
MLYGDEPVKRIVTITMNPTIDKSSTVGQVIPERKLYCGPPSYEPGGGGINVSRAIRKLGGESFALYPAGGPTGQMLKQLLDEEGLTHRMIRVDGWTRDNFIVLEQTSGQQYRFGMPGPELREEEWLRCLDELSSLEPAPDYIVASGSLPPGVPPDFYASAAEIANETGARLIVDTYGEALRLALEKGVYLIKPNIREFRELTGDDLKEEPAIKARAMQIVEKGQAKVVAISLGAAGVLLVSETGCERLQPPTVPIVSKVGAGDSMVAGIALSLGRGKSIRQAVRFGVASGTAAVMTPGTELCRREDAERLYAEMTSESF